MNQLPRALPESFHGIKLPGSSNIARAWMAQKLEWVLSSHEGLFDYWLEYTKSPIEALMLMALETVSQNFTCSSANIVSPIDSQRIAPHPGVWICPQYPIGRYVADFLVHFQEERPDFSTQPPGFKLEAASVIVECDGHEFHEKTKQQAAKDKSRDRAITAAGLTVLRFTGSEIFRDPMKCAQETLDLLQNRVWGLRRKAAQ